MKSLIYLLLLTAITLQLALATDDTLIDKTKGNDIADAVVRRIHRSGIFVDEQSLLRRIGFVESRFGEDPATYRDDYFGGIWQVDEDMFQKTKSVTDPKNVYQSIQEKFGIQWQDVTWNQLLMPFYSGLASRLYLASLNKEIPGTVAAQSVFWAQNYGTNKTAANFVTLVKALESDPICEGMMDICIVLDGSQSIGNQDFLKAKGFVADLANTFSLNSSRIAFVLYSDLAQTIFDFSNTLTPSQMNQAINAIRYPNKRTNTPAGLNMAVNFFKATNVRPGVPRVVTTFTDGESNLGMLPLAIANVRNAGLKSFAVGIGKGINQKELLQIALDIQSNVFTVTDFDALAEFFYQMKSATCDIPQEPDVGSNITGSLNNRERRYFKYDLPSEGITLKVEQGELNGWYSYTEETPNSAVHDGLFDNIFYIPNSKVKNTKQEPLKVFVTIEGTAQTPTEYVISSAVGNLVPQTETPTVSTTTEEPNNTPVSTTTEEPITTPISTTDSSTVITTGSTDQPETTPNAAQLHLFSISLTIFGTWLYFIQ